MKTRLRLFKYFLGMGYCYVAAWQRADRELAFQRRSRR